MIADALNRVGAGRSIVIDEANKVWCGNGVVEAAGQAGLEDVIVIDAEPDELVVVQRADLEGADREFMGLVDNRASELSAWNTEQLRKLAEGTGLAGLFTDDELARELARDPAAAFSATPAAADDTSTHRLVHIHVPTEQYDELLEQVQALAAHYGTDTLTSTVLAAVRAELATEAA
jgi:hypothetical protein